MNILTEAELLERLNTAKGVTVTRSTFKQSIRPLLLERGEARPLGTGKRAVWVYDGGDLWQWQWYLATRTELIRTGVWNSKRPYSVRDLEDIALLNEYSEITERLFGEKQDDER